MLGKAPWTGGAGRAALTLLWGTGQCLQCADQKAQTGLCVSSDVPGEWSFLRAAEIYCPSLELEEPWCCHMECEQH